MVAEPGRYRSIMGEAADDFFIKHQSGDFLGVLSFERTLTRLILSMMVIV